MCEREKSDTPGEYSIVMIRRVRKGVNSRIGIYSIHDNIIMVEGESKKKI